MKCTPIIALLLLVQLAFGQEEKRDFQRIGLLAGAQQSHLLDQQFSALAYRADEISLSFHYEGKWNRSNVHASFGAASGDLYPSRFKNRIIYNTTGDIHGNIETDTVHVTGLTRTAVIEIGYTYDIVHHASFDLRVGGTARNQLMYPSTFTNLGTLNAASLLANIEMHWYPGSRHEMQAGLSIPVIGYNTRFPYSGTVSRPNQTLFEAFFDGGTELVTLDTYQQVNFTAGYRYQVSKHMGLGLRYDFMYQYYSIPVPLTSYSNRMGIVADIVF